MKAWLVIIIISIVTWWNKKPRWSWDESKWLSEHGLGRYEELLRQHGVGGLLDFADERRLKAIPSEHRGPLLEASRQLFDQLVLNFWLVRERQDDQADWLRSHGVTSLDQLSSRAEVADQLLAGLAEAAARLPSGQAEMAELKQQLLEEMRTSRHVVTPTEPRPLAWWRNLLSGLVALSTILLSDLVYRWWRDGADGRAITEPLRHTLTALLQLTLRCHVRLLWEDRRRVGGVVSLEIKVERVDGRPYDLRSDPAALRVQVHVRGAPVACALEWRAADEVRCSFPARAAGTYWISVMLAGRHVAGSPYRRHFLAERPDADRSLLLSHSSTAVMTQGQPHSMSVELRDAFNNPCEPDDWEQLRPLLTVSVEELDTGLPVVAYEHLEPELGGRRVGLRLVLSRQGCFKGTVAWDGRPVRGGCFHVVVLSAYHMTSVKKNVSTRSVSFSARLTSVDGVPLNKPKDVWCYVSPKQLTIRETVFFFIPRKLYTFRLCPSTRLTPTNERNTACLPSVTVSDGCQPVVELTLSQRDQLAATFTLFLLRNVGGSETFSDRRRFFYRELELTAAGRSRRPLALHVRRAALLESSLDALRGASTGDWTRPFEVRFDSEEALDYGGVRREWFELVCEALFERRGGLFAPLADSGNGSQALVHPRPAARRPQHVRLRHFEFAGRVAGKCLLESAQGGASRQLVRASFTRSFLAQLIGLRVSYKHFEQDDPELYRTKVTLIETCPADELAELELTFTDEEFGERGQLLQTVELRSGGARTPVTAENRLEYLQCLAQYRLANRCKPEVDAFLRGLNDLVPDNLLGIFDENELELLMCGSSEFSVAELRRHHTVTDHNAAFEKVLGWFWTALENFSAEEGSRLLQFTTGCARLPAGGFAELMPKFQISSYPEFGALPVAHTCFNQLCLPDHVSYQEFERALLLAIREGNVGFGLL
ncbi:apoptosis-resistant E3 ubiquitin protein ligase 1-like [Amphibalanus amphitrite]|uniref:apoptosis-resistant E3 ubiquitin protein ligase 1-like n=1 Tax=Amphibalanus amphitrite TaxID=1232801 RepID=UPI001C904DAF|nr:apoptosis-resistant E3 ubiquitin protein ligase 1-like [Amphibalanus amphitrite]